VLPLEERDQHDRGADVRDDQDQFQERPEDAAALAQAQDRQLETQAQEQQLTAFADAYPYIAEVVAGHVAKVGYYFGHAFEYGLDLILDALEQRRESQ
jgi:hypothetical protein